MSRTIRSLVVVALAAVCLGTVATVSAATRVAQPSLACLKTASSTAAMDACVGAAYARARKELAAVYAKALAGKGLAQGDPAQLQRAERQWIAFRNADCTYAASLNAGGTLSAVTRGICLVRDTVDRVNALQDYLSTA